MHIVNSTQPCGLRTCYTMMILLQWCDGYQDVHRQWVVGMCTCIHALIVAILFNEPFKKCNGSLPYKVGNPIGLHDL